MVVVQEGKGIIGWSNSIIHCYGLWGTCLCFTESREPCSLNLLVLSFTLCCNMSNIITQATQICSSHRATELENRAVRPQHLRGSLYCLQQQREHDPLYFHLLALLASSCGQLSSSTSCGHMTVNVIEVVNFALVEKTEGSCSFWKNVDHRNHQIFQNHKELWGLFLYK